MKAAFADILRDQAATALAQVFGRYHRKLVDRLARKARTQKRKQMKGGIHRKAITDLWEWEEAELCGLKAKFLSEKIKQLTKEMAMFKIAQGKKVKDSITGFSGIVTGRAEYITGCRQYLVSAKSKDGKRAECAWYDEDRLTGLDLSRQAPEVDGGPQANEAPTK